MDGLPIRHYAEHDPATGYFKNGNTQYRARQKRLAERLADLTAEYNPSAAQRVLLAVAARHLDDAERARTAERRVRASNAAARLLRSIPRREAPLPSPVAGLLRGGRRG